LFNGENGVFIIFWLNWAKGFLTKKALKNYTFEYQGKTVYEQNDVYIIMVTRPNWEGQTRMYITTDTYAIVTIDSRYNNENQAKPNNDEQWWFKKLQLYVNFTYKNGLWQLNSIEDYRKSGLSNGSIFESLRAIRITKVSNSNKLHNKNKINPETDLFNYPIPYDPEFWMQYNAPLESEKEKKIKADFR